MQVLKHTELAIACAASVAVSVIIVFLPAPRF
jgi:hypothetical protein